MGGIFEGLRFRQEGQRLLDHWIPVGHDTQSLELTELGLCDLFLDVDLQPVHVVGEVLFGEWNVLTGEVLLEVVDDGVVNLKILIDRAVGKIVRGEMEESVLVIWAEFFLEAIALGALDFLVGRDAAAAVDGASRIGHLDFAIAGVRGA